ncbi:reverse transcriptase family protein [Gimesia chilikensis]|uniref:RNA-directed DNA polymerase n=1 Tax=Gimesia chilikensis TaxID=2605989 RepID=A0A517PUP6_9PLAN|nr:reverse transcriptase family protein [Gimesia chilikensis]QDT23080.1 Reverse transcriptase (RNA-dependent DNA polymerase) [Gimesia chilikensis]
MKDWEKYFIDRGLPTDTISTYLSYISQLSENQVPVIFEFEHLTKLLGLKRNVLAKIVNSPEHFHRKFSIRKRSGGKRIIVSPYPSLLYCQKWIYVNLLLKQKVHTAAHGFVPGKSIFSNAKLHLSKRSMLKMDLKNFFPSIPMSWVINFFHDLGYAKNVSSYLASLCCYEHRLSQGAATSPYLSNLLLKNLDDRLSSISNSYRLQYSRYADDITFSGDYIPSKLIKIIEEIVDDYGLAINQKKTRLHTKPGQRIVTGLSVVGEELTIPRKMKRDLRQEVHFIRKYGYLSHISKMKINHPFYLESIAGRFQFWLQAEPENEFAKESLTYLQKIKG